MTLTRKPKELESSIAAHLKEQNLGFSGSFYLAKSANPFKSYANFDFKIL